MLKFLLIIFLFSTGVFANNEKTILIFGDAGTGKSEQNEVAQAMYKTCKEQHCDFGLMLGDNIYENGVSSVKDRQFKTKFEVPYTPFQSIPGFLFYGVLGNHDYKGSVEAQIDYSKKSRLWRIPAKTYTVPTTPGWLHIFVLNTEKISKKQIAEARKTLCGKSGWRFLAGHHPIYSNGHHGDQKNLKKYLLPLIQECKVQAYFSGHDHHQEHIHTKDFEQIIQGAAGKLRPLEEFKPRDEIIQRFAQSTLGFALLKVSEQKAEVDFFDSQSISLYRFDLSLDSSITLK